MKFKPVQSLNPENQAGRADFKKNFSIMLLVLEKKQVSNVFLPVRIISHTR